jgi:enoyl-CoA hydratase/carnithine racemase
VHTGWGGPGTAFGGDLFIRYATQSDERRGDPDMPHQLTFFDSETIAEILISAPGRNALDRAGIGELHALLDEVLEHDHVRTVVISGAEGNFCAGRIRDMSLVTKDEIATDLQPILDMNSRLESYPVPIIAAVEGAAFGFGFGLATLCDVTIVGEGATLALTELAHGLPPLIVLSYFFKFVPYKVGLDLALTGRELDAQEALRLGLATSVCASGGALAAARVLAGHIAAVEADAIRLLRRFARDQAALADPTAAASGADQIATLLAGKGH